MSTTVTDRCTQLKFDSFTSDWIGVDNGIVQGDLLSMILYLFYNADLLEDMGKMETKVGYVDDVNFFAEGRTFDAAYAKLSDMMTREGGGQDWSKLHNSKVRNDQTHLSRFFLPVSTGLSMPWKAEGGAPAHSLPLWHGHQAGRVT